MCFVVADTIQNLLLGSRFRDGIVNALKSLRFELEILCPKKPCWRESHRTGSCSAAITLFPTWQKRLMLKQVS